MSIGKDRESFETMARRFGATEDQLRQDEDGCYFDRETRTHWIIFGIAWAESRAALVIEVPGLKLCCEDFGVEFIKNIEAAGVKVKS